MSEAQTTLSDYLTSEEMAIKFGVPEQTIRDWAVKGQVVATKIGARWFFPKEQFVMGPVKIICTTCHNEITGFQDEISLKEGHISGMCQNCQNGVFKEIDDNT